MQSVGVAADFNSNAVPTNGNPAQKLNKISSKKFFKSKIDFTAPIKSLQHKGGTNDPNLSDDSYMMEQSQALGFRQFTQGYPVPLGGGQSNVSMLSGERGSRVINQSEIV
jgi:hypothetical protein